MKNKILPPLDTLTDANIQTRYAELKAEYNADPAIRAVFAEIDSMKPILDANILSGTTEKKTFRGHSGLLPRTLSMLRTSIAGNPSLAAKGDIKYELAHYVGWMEVDWEARYKAEVRAKRASELALGRLRFRIEQEARKAVREYTRNASRNAKGAANALAAANALLARNGFMPRSEMIELGRMFLASATLRGADKAALEARIEAVLEAAVQRIAARGNAAVVAAAGAGAEGGRRTRRQARRNRTRRMRR